MHPTAYQHAIQFYNSFCSHLTETSKVVDFGAFDVNGTLKPIFKENHYIGVDMSTGPNVDVVCKNDDTPFENDSVDVIVSSSCFEHDECFWETFLEMCRIAKEGGLIYINAPSAGEYHGYPGDCWRFYKDSWSALCKWAVKHGYSMKLEYSHVSNEGHWKDSIGVFRKEKKISVQQTE